MTKLKLGKIADDKPVKVTVELGDSGIYSVLHSLILAVEEQRLILDQHQEDDLRHAAIGVIAMRNDLVSALGLQADKA